MPAGHLRLPILSTAIILGFLIVEGTLYFPAQVASRDSAALLNYPDSIFLKTALGPSQVIVADLAGNNQLDILTVNSTDNSVSLLKGLGRGNFSGAVRISVDGERPISVATGRLTGSGKRDLVTANSGSSNLSILSSDGDGSYRVLHTIKAGGDPLYVVTADLDRSGYDSLITANRQDNHVRVFANGPDHIFRSPLALDTGGQAPVALLTVDVNNDGRSDIVSANNESANISVIINNGHGQFLPARQYATGSGPVAVCAADFNGDGFKDLATADEDDETVSVLINNRDGTFRAPQYFKVRRPQSITAADVNGDNHIDLIVSEQDGDGVSVLLNRGDGSFGDPIRIPVKNSHVTSLATADLNSDGKIDIVGSDFIANNVVLLLQGVHVPNIEVVTPAENTKVYSKGDSLDQDIRLRFNTDLDVQTLTSDTVFVYGNMSGYHRVGLSYSAQEHTLTVRPSGALHDATVNARFQPGEVVSVIATAGIRSTQGIPMKHGFVASFSVRPATGTGTFVEGQRVSCVKIPGRLRVADMDNDGHVDLVALCREVDSVRLHFNNGKANFDETITLPTKGNGPWDLWPADFNRDGLMDIAVVNTFTSDLVLFYNEGHRRFAPPHKLISDAGPMGVVAADVNGDGWLDLITVTKGVPAVHVYLNDGKGGFLKPTTYKVAPSPYHITARDINGDGAVDLLMTNLESDRGTVLLNNGDGTFRTPQEFPLLLAKALVDDPIDVNQDGKPDMVTVNTASDDLSVFIADGNGKFRDAVKYAVGASPTDQIFGDFNADGYPDVAVTLDGGQVAILINDGKGGFTKTMVIPVGKNPTSPVTADFNEDGALDLVIANQYSHDISILMNSTTNSLATRKGTSQH